MIEGALDVPVAGSHALLLFGTTIYVFAAAAIGIFLGTLARTMECLQLVNAASVARTLSSAKFGTTKTRPSATARVG